MSAVLHSGWGRALAALLVLALVIALAAAVLGAAPEGRLERLKQTAAALCAAALIGFAAGLRGKRELERPWELPDFGLEQLDGERRTEASADDAPSASQRGDPGGEAE